MEYLIKDSIIEDSDNEKIMNNLNINNFFILMAKTTILNQISDRINIEPNLSYDINNLPNNTKDKVQSFLKYIC